MTSLMDIAAALAQPWADLYGGSALIQSAVTFLHFGGLLTAGGSALGADAGVLRHARRPGVERVAFLRELPATHRVVVAGLAAVVASGLLLLAADVEALLPSPVFWAKMGAFVLLLLNGLSLRRAEHAVSAAELGDPADPAPGASPGEGADPGEGERRWRALRAASLRSAGLWFAVLFLGTLLTAAA
jgi:uncharacterized membrane protein